MTDIKLVPLWFFPKMSYKKKTAVIEQDESFLKAIFFANLVNSEYSKRLKVYFRKKFSTFQKVTCTLLRKWALERSLGPISRVWDIEMLELNPATLQREAPTKEK